MKYQKKPVVIDATRYTDQAIETAEGAYNFLKFLDGCKWRQDDDGIAIITLEGEMKASKGDWIIKGVKGEFYPCKPDIFEATYEAA